MGATSGERPRGLCSLGPSLVETVIAVIMIAGATG
jgi:hypothetical protein